MVFGWMPTGWFRGRASKVARVREKRKNRSGTFSTLTLGSAAIAFLLALFGVGPFAVQALVFDFGPAGSGPLPASAVFPQVSPVQKVVDVYDPAPPQSRPVTQPRPNPTPIRSPQPTPSQEPGDNN